MNGKSKLIKALTNTLQIVNLRRLFLPLIGLFLISITILCGQKSNNETNNEIYDFIKLAQTKSFETFDGWNIWKRNDGLVFDYLDNEYRLLIIFDEKEKVFFKEIFPTQDSIFHPLNEIDSRSEYYPFKVSDFSDKIFLFQKLNVDNVKSIIEDSLIMFVNEDFAVIYSQKGKNIRESSRFIEYLKYDNYWYYYLKKDD